MRTTSSSSAVPIPEPLSDETLRELVKQVETVDPFTAAFTQLVTQLFPDDTKLQQDIHGSCRNTVRLLESAWRTRMQVMSTPEYIIDTLQNGRWKDLLRLALLTAAAKTLFTRCQQCEQDMAVLE